MTGEGLNRGLGQTIEWRIILCYLCLVAIGVLSIFASGYSAEGSASLLDFSTRAGKQILWAGISLSVGCVILFVIKPFLWEVISTPAYIFVLLLLVATLVLGSEVNGSRSWFKLGPLSFQPCELSKITTSLLLAHFLRGHGFNARKMNDLATVLAVVGIPTLLILAEKETGTVLVYLGYIFVLYREGLSGWWIILFLVLAVLFILSIRFPLWVGFAVLAVLVSWVLRQAAQGSGKAHAELFLQEREDFSQQEDMQVLVGRRGLTSSVLRPAGIADFDGVRLNVVTEGGFIEKDVSVEIVRVEGTRIVVRNAA